MNECTYGWCECAWWHPGGLCAAENQGEDYCPCFNPEDSVSRDPETDEEIKSFVSWMVRRFCGGAS